MNIAFLDPKVETQTPTYATDGSAGLDIVATSIKRVERSFSKTKDRHVGGYIEYGTNLVVEIPTGFVGLLLPKSSSRDYTQRLANSLGVIDSDYRGELKFSYKSDDENQRHYRSVYQKGDVVGQLVIVPCPQFIPTLVLFDQLGKTERGEGGHGSTEKPKELPSTADTDGGEVLKPSEPVPSVPSMPNLVNEPDSLENLNPEVAEQAKQAQLDYADDLLADHGEPKDFDPLTKPDGTLTDESNEGEGSEVADLVPDPFPKGVVGKVMSRSGNTVALSDEQGTQYTFTDTEEKLKDVLPGNRYVLKRGHLVEAPEDAA